mgnify:CR=1 FL=1
MMNFLKNNLKIFEDFILKNFLAMGVSTNYTLNYDEEISSLAFNKNFFDDIKDLFYNDRGKTKGGFVQQQHPGP